MACYQCDGDTLEEIQEIRAARDAQIRAFNEQAQRDADSAIGLHVPFLDAPYEDTTDDSTFAEGPVQEFSDEWNKVESAQGDVAAPKRAGRPKKAASDK